MDKTLEVVLVATVLVVASVVVISMLRVSPTASINSQENKKAVPPAE